MHLADINMPEYKPRGRKNKILEKEEENSFDKIPKVTEDVEKEQDNIIESFTKIPEDVKPSSSDYIGSEKEIPIQKPKSFETQNMTGLNKKVRLVQAAKDDKQIFTVLCDYIENFKTESMLI
jgi:hypothetical protein